MLCSIAGNRFWSPHVGNFRANQANEGGTPMSRNLNDQAKREVLVKFVGSLHSETLSLLPTAPTCVSLRQDSTGILFDGDSIGMSFFKPVSSPTIINYTIQSGSTLQIHIGGLKKDG